MQNPIAPRPWPIDSAKSWLAWRNALEEMTGLKIDFLRKEADAEICRISRCARPPAKARPTIVPRSSGAATKNAMF